MFTGTNALIEICLKLNKSVDIYPIDFFILPFFFLDEKETGQICKSIFEPDIEQARRNANEKTFTNADASPAIKIKFHTVSSKAAALLLTYAFA